MSTTPTVITAGGNKVLAQVRSFVGAALFLALQRFPKLLQLHRNEHSWAVFRFAMACFGAALVILPLSLLSGWGWITAIFGLVLFVVAILLPPAETESTTDRKARELGTQMVVSGGEYQPGNAPLAEARLFISPEHVWALDSHLEPLVVIPTGEISRLRLDQIESGWMLRVHWGDHKAEFIYKGFFAERFARLAQESIESASPSMLSAPKRRAATAS
jgi:hypothetical protein